MYSDNELSLSITIKAPIRCFFKYSRANPISYTILSLSEIVNTLCLPRSCVLPNCSSTVLISGWKIITSAKGPHITTYSSNKPIAVKSNKSLKTFIITIITIPLKSIVNLTLFLILFNIKYKPAQTRHISITSLIIVSILSIVIIPPIILFLHCI